MSIRIKTQDPVLQNIIDETNRSFLSLENQSYFVGTPRNTEKRVNSSFGDLILCDPTKEGFVVVLPPIEKTDIGKIVTVANTSSSTNTITIKPNGNDTIAGSSSVLQTTAYLKTTFLAAKDNLWVYTTSTPAPTPASTDYYQLIISDDTEFTETSTSSVTKKSFRIVIDPNNIPTSWRIVISLWSTGGLDVAQSTIDIGGDTITLSSMYFSEHLFFGDLTLSSAPSETLITATIGLNVLGGTNTAHLKYTDIYAYFGD